MVIVRENCSPWVIVQKSRGAWALIREAARDGSDNMGNTDDYCR